MDSLFSAGDVARIFGLQESRVRYWAQTGFVGPSARAGGRGAYTFADLVSVKAAKELLARGVSLQRARKSLEALKAQLPALERPLAKLRVLSDGDRTVVVGEGAPYEPMTGQLLLEFAVDALEGEVAELMKVPLSADGAAEPLRAAPAAPAPTRTETAYAWFLEGVRLEREGRGDEALMAFYKALDGDPALAAAHTNLGNLLYQRGELGDARTHYERALELDPEQPEARYNLGNLLDEIGERVLAIGEWLRVVAGSPDFADAHFNLGVAMTGADPLRARRHLEDYLHLVEEGEWAQRARDLLSDLGA